MEKRDLHLLVNDIRNNNKDAFNQLFLIYFEKLVQFAGHLLHNTELAEDVVADVFTNIWIKREKLTGILNVEAYLYTSVKNACFDQITRERKNIQEVKVPTEVVSTGIVSIEAREFKLLLKETINALPEQQRLVFLLIKEHGRKSVEVAEILGISVRTVENHLYKAVKTLADEISHYLGYNPQQPKGKKNGLYSFFFSLG